MRASINTAATRASWTLFQGLFFVATLVAVFATFSAISGVSPVDPLNGQIGWLLAINTVLIAILGWVIVRRYQAVRRQSGGAGASLTRRFFLLFGLAALIPAALVAIFLGATMTRGLDNWFNERIDTIVEETADVARDSYRDFSVQLDSDITLMALDLNNASDGLREGSSLYANYVRTQAALRQFSEAYIIGANGEYLVPPESVAAARFIRPPQSDLLEAQTGTIVQNLYERSGLVTGLKQLSGSEGAYLFVYKGFDPQQLAQMRRAEAALTDYRAAKDRSGRLQWLFALGYAQLAALVLLLSGRLGLEAARTVTGPITRLAEAAKTVRDGNLDVRVPAPAVRDELYELTRSFNTMTEQLGQQRVALVRAREDEEDRRQFVETLLAEVSAGVIRIDDSLIVTLANRSASELLDTGDLQGRHLSEFAPDFVSYAEDTIETDSAIDASLEMTGPDTSRHFRLKATMDPAGGCVLTFDDTTRLVTAQRQMAWRDVARRIAHEIRNPLTPIQLSTERLKRRFSKYVEEPDQDVFNRCIDTILRQVSDIGRMVEEFSNFARMPKPNLNDFNIAELLSEAVFAQGMVQPEIRFDMKPTSGPVVITGDERLIGQAMGNLLKNAAEAIEGLPDEREVQGVIDVALNTSRDDQIEIIVEDNGPGFPEEARERLLEPYVTTRQEGTGLGLAIVNRIIADHGGSISLQNRKDGLAGARVRIVLPFIQEITKPVAIPILEGTEV